MTTDRLAEIRKHYGSAQDLHEYPPLTRAAVAAIRDLLALLDEQERARVERDKLAAYQNLVLDNIKRERDTLAAEVAALREAMAAVKCGGCLGEGKIQYRIGIGLCANELRTLRCPRCDGIGKPKEIIAALARSVPEAVGKLDA